jgi:hypothetical protein
MERPCKIHDPRSGKYVSCTTRNLSSGGMLLDVPRLLNLQPGDHLHVGVAMTRRQHLLQANDMLRVSVRRSLPTVDDHTLLAVEIDASQSAWEPQAWRTAA